MVKLKTIGFGFDPNEALQHYMVVTSASANNPVYIFERFTWDETEPQISQLPPADDAKCKVMISRNKWLLCKEALEAEMNATLKATNRRASRFKNGMVPVERLLGKEMIVLLWAIEDCDPSIIPNAIRNWKGLSREERWWLFTMTNATTGDAYDKRGWRKALRYAITENPIRDKNKQTLLIDSLYQQTDLDE